MPNADPAHRAQLEQSREELFEVARRLARRLRDADPHSATQALAEVDDLRRALGESPFLEAKVTVRLLELIGDALAGREP